MTLHYANDWTGAQYSLVRFLLASILLIHFVCLIPWAAECFSNQGVLSDHSLSPFMYAFPNIFLINDSVLFIQILLSLASLAAICFGIGWHDKIAAVFLWYILACLFGRNPLISNPSIPFLGFILLIHLAIPGSPFGSLHARTSIDPRNNWEFPPALFACLWIVMSVAYTYSGIYKLYSQSWVDGTALERVLQNPLSRDFFVVDLLLLLPSILLKCLTWAVLFLEVVFAFLAIFKWTRLWAWLAMLLMHFGILSTVSFAELSLGMIIVHAFTFDPRWLRSQHFSKPFSVFYDGSCGLCHRTVRFALAELIDLEAVTFSPLHNDYFKQTIPQDKQEDLPDSIVVVDHNQQVLVKSTAIIYLYKRLGGYWRILGFTVACVPRPLRDWAYDLVARVRLKLFAKPDEACPLLPPDLRQRFQH